MPTRPPLAAAVRRPATAALIAIAAVAVRAQVPYKVVGPDGRVTYTDRPQIAATDSVVRPLARTAAAPGEVELPLELRQAVERWPVTLYVGGGDDCAPCADARDQLRRRGVPFALRSVASDEDVAALERLSGGRELPTVTIGAQVLRGFAPPLWASYLDAAGYPRESRLPVNYRYPPATPLVARAAAAASAPAPDLPSTTLPSLPIAEGPVRF